MTDKIKLNFNPDVPTNAIEVIKEQIDINAASDTNATRWYIPSSFDESFDWIWIAEANNNLPMPYHKIRLEIDKVFKDVNLKRLFNCEMNDNAFGFGDSESGPFAVGLIEQAILNRLQLTDVIQNVFELGLDHIWCFEPDKDRLPVWAMRLMPNIKSKLNDTRINIHEADAEAEADDNLSKLLLLYPELEYKRKLELEYKRKPEPKYMRNHAHDERWHNDHIKLDEVYEEFTQMPLKHFFHISKRPAFGDDEYINRERGKIAIGMAEQSVLNRPVADVINSTIELGTDRELRSMDDIFNKMVKHVYELGMDHIYSIKDDKSELPMWAIRLIPSNIHGLSGEKWHSDYIDFDKVCLNNLFDIMINKDTLKAFDIAQSDIQFKTFDLDHVHVLTTNNWDSKEKSKYSTWAVKFVPKGKSEDELPEQYHGNIDPIDQVWPMEPDDKFKFYWLFDDDVDPDPNWQGAFSPDIGSDACVHIFQRVNPSTGLVYDYKGCRLVPYDTEDVDRAQAVRSKRVPKPGCRDKPFDIIFLSNDEEYADDNYDELLSLYPKAKRVNGVKGFAEAHKKAAELATTEMFYVVDADAIIEPTFKFEYYPNQFDRNTTHVWRSKNPVNDLVYGYGGVKLFPRQAVLDYVINEDDIDFTTSVTKKFKALPIVSNTTKIDYDYYTAFRSAFRECAKLTAAVIAGNKAAENQKRLDAWHKPKGCEHEIADWVRIGAECGVAHGNAYKDDPKELRKINDDKFIMSRFYSLSIEWTTMQGIEEEYVE